MQMTAKPKILLLSPVVPYPPTDGGKLRTFKLCNLLADKYDITILARVRHDDLDFEKYLGNGPFSKIIFIPVVYPETANLTKIEKPSSGKMVVNKIQDWTDVSKGMPYGLDFKVEARFREALIECLHQGYDIVHAEHLHMSQYLRFAQDIPSVLTEMDVEYEKVRRSIQAMVGELRGKWVTKQVDRLVKPIKLKYQLKKIKEIESSLADSVDVCIAMSESDKRLLQEMNPTLRIEIVPNGVDISYFQPTEIDDGSLSLTYTGHMGYLPNIDAVQFFHKDIYPHIRAAFPHIKLNIVGKNPEERIIALGKIDPSITVTGFVEDVRPFMTRDSIYVAPLRLGSGTRLKILEAMAMKMAVVSTTIGCEGLDVENDKNILIADDPGDFAEAVTELIRNPKKRRQIGDEARKLVEKSYDWSSIAKLQDHVYKELLKK